MDANRVRVTEVAEHRWVIALFGRARPALTAMLDTTEAESLATLAAAALLTLDHDTRLLNRDGDDQLAILVPDEDRRRELLLALGQRFDHTHQRLLGEIGEELVLAAAREQLRSLRHPRLADQVHRVSLGSDALGYDIVAPRVIGQHRLLEVKATTTTDPFGFYLSRNEHTTGGRNPDDWFLIACLITNVDQRAGEIIGWSSHPDLARHMPTDNEAGAWQSVRVELPSVTFTAGLLGPS
jgi:hypothetical protein